MTDIKLSPDDINRIMVEAVAASAIGKTLHDAITRQIAQLSKSYDNPFDGTIKNLISAEAQRIIHEEFATQIREKAAERIKAALTDEALQAILERVVRTVITAFDRNY